MMKKEMRKLLVLDDTLNQVCASTPDRVFGLYCGLIHESIVPKIKAYSDQMRSAKSAEVRKYDSAYSEWSRSHNGQKISPELRSEIAALQVEYGVVEELVANEELANRLGDEEIEVTIPQMPIHVIPPSTQAGVIIVFMNSGCISVEAAQEFLDKIAAKEDGKKGPSKKKAK